jgi:hypothetical protein
MVLDASNDRAIVFGGESSGGRLRDVWALSLSSLTWDSVATQGTQPSAREGHSAIYDADGQRMIVFAGNDGALKNDMWQLSLPSSLGSSQWSLIDTTSAVCAREDHTAIFIPNNNNFGYNTSFMAIFGGVTPTVAENVYRNDLWLMALPSANSVTNKYPSNISCSQYVACTGECPTVRAYQSHIWDPASTRIVIFGGDYDSFSGTSNRKTFSSFTNGWPTETQNAPTGYSRTRAASVYDSASAGRLVVFGGCSTSVANACANLTFYNATTSMSLASGTDGNWSTDSTSPPPRARYDHAGVFDVRRNRLIVFGGAFPAGCDSFVDNPYKTNETWVLDYSAIGNLAACSMSKACAELSWTTPGQNGVAIQAYDVRYSSSPITESSFSSATQSTAPTPGAAGTTQYASVTGLSASHTYYFAVKAKSKGYWSLISNVVSATTASSGSTACNDCSGGASARPAWDEDAARNLQLLPPSPNPAAGSVAVEYSVPASRIGSRLQLTVFDVLGRRVRVLQDGPADAGRGSAQWDLRDASGRRVERGLYYVRLMVGGEKRIRAVIAE